MADTESDRFPLHTAAREGRGIATSIHSQLQDNDIANATLVAAFEGLLKVSYQADEIHILSASVYPRV